MPLSQVLPSRFLATIATVLLVGLTTAALGQTPLYTLTVLGAVGGAGSVGYGVNNSGRVTGAAGATGNMSAHAFLSGPNGEPLTAANDLGTLGGVNSTAVAVNDTGQVTGGADLADGYRHAFLSGPNGGPLQDLRSLPGKPNSFGFGINASAQVAGYAITSDRYRPVPRAFLSAVNGGPLTDLGTLGGPTSFARAVNDDGQVTGGADLADGTNHAFLSAANGGLLKDLGTLGGPNSSGYGVNASGQVTGGADLASGYSRAFLSGPNGVGLTDLGTLPGSLNSYGLGINASGQVVGSVLIAAGVTHAIVVTNAVMTDLNSLIPPNPGFTLAVAFGVSDTGFITGYGRDTTGGQQAFLLTPIRTLIGLSFPASVPGGTVVTATVTLSGPAPVDTVVGLSSSDSSVVRLHRAVIVPAGSSSATFAINTYRSHTTKTVTIQATLGAVTQTGDLTITGR